MTRIATLPKSISREWLQDAIAARTEISPRGCWEWTSTRNSQGYGRLWVPGVGHRAAHRISAHLWVEGFDYGDSPLLVCHHCDNPPCVNPAHLFIGTARDNMRDASMKGRLRGAPGPRDDLLRYPRIRECDQCGVAYEPSPDKRGRSRTCSQACAIAARSSKRRGKGVRVTPETAQLILAMLASGATGRATAEHFGVSTCTVSVLKNKKRVIDR